MCLTQYKWAHVIYSHHANVVVCHVHRVKAAWTTNRYWSHAAITPGVF